MWVTTHDCSRGSCRRFPWSTVDDDAARDGATVSSVGAPDSWAAFEEELPGGMDAGRDPAAVADLRSEAEKILGQWRDGGFAGRRVA
jgi:hypothetical protein